MSLNLGFAVSFLDLCMCIYIYMIWQTVLLLNMKDLLNILKFILNY